MSSDPTANAGTPPETQDKPERGPTRNRPVASAFENPVALIACVAAVAVAVINGCTLWLDRDDKIEDKLDTISETVISLNTTLTGPSGLAHRVIRLEDIRLQATPGGPLPPNRLPPPQPEVPSETATTQRQAVEDP